jgi:hypothetical protein
MSGSTKGQELRCFCGRKPLLATYGIDKGELFVHIRVYKQSRIYGEAVIKGGTVKLHCRECLRWHTVIMRQPKTAELTEASAPSEVGAITTADHACVPEPTTDKVSPT